MQGRKQESSRSITGRIWSNLELPSHHITSHHTTPHRWRAGSMRVLSGGLTADGREACCATERERSVQPLGIVRKKREERRLYDSDFSSGG